MDKSKAMIAVLVVLACAYSILSLQTNDLDSEDLNTCKNKFVGTLALWDSGCFYSALYSEDQKQLEYEMDKLSTFVGNDGVDREIFWYRLQLAIKYRTKLKLNYQEIHSMYREYLLTEHSKLNRQVQYLHFLIANDLKPLAQSTLDRFCSIYLLPKPSRGVKRFAYMESILKEYDVNLSVDYCKNGEPLKYI